MDIIVQGNALGKQACLAMSPTATNNLLDEMFVRVEDDWNVRLNSQGFTLGYVVCPLRGKNPDSRLARETGGN
jgi:hypothetical protein